MPNGNKSDRVPNIYWRSVSTDQLRQEPRYVALPPVSLLGTTQGALSYRYVRQESQLWRELHDGMLTTGRLKQALGMHEPKAAQLVGIHPGSRGSSHLLSAYFHLLTTASSSSSGSKDDWADAAATATSSSSSSSSSSGRDASNEAARRLFNERLASEGAAAGRPAGSPASGPMSADLAAACHRVGMAGDIPVKLAWGKAQEAAALHCLLQLFPEAAVEEVGLFVVNLNDLPASWGIDLSAESLPRCGASPDGLIVHKLHLQQQDLQAAARLSAAKDPQVAVQWLLQQGLDQQLCTASRPARGVPVADSSSSSSSSEQGEAEADPGGEQESAAGSDRVTAAAAVDTSSSGCDTLGVTAPDDSISAAAAETAASSSSSSSSRAGLSASTRQADASEEPRSSSQPDSSTPAAAAEPWTAAGGLAFEPVAADLLRLLQRLQEAPGSSSSSSSDTGRQVQPVQAAAASAAEGSSSSSSSTTLFVREVVEVKNHCPFAFRSKRKGKKGKVHVSFGFNARGPAQRVHPQWVPQLQMHMLATGCQSALLVSRCADSGVRVFRLWRDDTYLQTMLKLLSVLQTQHVLQGVQPSAATFSGLPGYRAFLHRTATLARSAECIAAAGEEVTSRVPEAADGYNLVKFWQ
uniref:Uncharacterized protein n=1 Tax=Tetradesmus obliquus TaxID=3088 RepID=A0A383WDU8_TETOB|eukprot:jgi/Sobl393_1/4931/SZX75611.1